MNSAIVEEGSVASGDGRYGYAARRRNLACRPLALGRHHGAHESLPTTATDQPADHQRPSRPRRDNAHRVKTEDYTSGNSHCPPPLLTPSAKADEEKMQCSGAGVVACEIADGDGEAGGAPVIHHSDELPGAIGMCPMLDGADVEGVLVGEGAKCDAVAAAARDAPPFKLEPQRLGHGVRVGRQRVGDELGDRGGHFVRQPFQRTYGSWRQLNGPGLRITHVSPYRRRSSSLETVLPAA